MSGCGRRRATAKLTAVAQPFPAKAGGEPKISDRAESAVSREIAGDSASARGDEREALSCWHEALGMFLGEAMTDEAARVASKMATAEENLGETEAACSHYAQAAELYKSAGHGHRVPMCLNNLAMLRKLSGDLEEAASVLHRALDEASHCHGRLHGETALIATNLGAVLCERGDLLGAEQQHMQALAIREQLFGPAHPEVGLSLGHLGVIHQMRGQMDRARSFYSAALAVLDEFPGVHAAERKILRENLAGL